MAAVNTFASNKRSPTTVLLESGGTLLTIGGIADTSMLVRLGTEIVGGVRAWAIGATSTIGAALQNTTPATGGATVQRSPGIMLGGTAWDSTPGVSRTEEWLLEAVPASGGTVSSQLTIRRRQDGGAWSALPYISSAGLIRTITLQADTFAALGANVVVMYPSISASQGLGTHSWIRTNYDGPMVISHTSRTDGVNNIVHSTTYDRNASAITNAATMRLMSYNWVDNANANHEVASIRTDGALHQVVKVATTGTLARLVGSGADEGLKTVVQEETLSPDAIETAMATVIPKGSVIRSAHFNVQAALTGGGTTVTASLGTAADPDKYGTCGYPTQADSLAQNAKSDWVAGALAELASDETVVLTGTATGGAADGNTKLSVGSVRIVIIYDTFASLADA